MSGSPLERLVELVMEFGQPGDRGFEPEAAGAVTAAQMVADSPPDLPPRAPGGQFGQDAGVSPFEAADDIGMQVLVMGVAGHSAVS